MEDGRRKKFLLGMSSPLQLSDIAGTGGSDHSASMLDVFYGRVVVWFWSMFTVQYFVCIWSSLTVSDTVVLSRSPVAAEVDSQCL